MPYSEHAGLQNLFKSKSREQVDFVKFTHHCQLLPTSPPNMTRTASSASSRPATRAQNADAHPGLAAQGEKRRRRTKAEIEADKVKAAGEKAAKEAKKKAGLERIAAIEKRLVEEDNDVTPKPIQKSRHLRRTSSHAFIPLYSDNNSESPTEGPAQSDMVSSDHEGDTDIEDRPAPKKQKVSTLKAEDASKPTRREKATSEGRSEERSVVDMIDKDKGMLHGKNEAKSVYVLFP
jgi:hypothetical protein